MKSYFFLSNPQWLPLNSPCILVYCLQSDLRDNNLIKMPNNLLEILQSIIFNLFIGCVVIFSYHLSYEVAKKQTGWPGYNKVLLWIGLLSILNLSIGYDNLEWRNFAIEVTGTILISALVGVYNGNKDAKKIERNFYREMKKEQIALYQDYFNKSLNSVDIHNNSEWASGRNYDKDKLAKDDAIMKDIFNESERNGLRPVYLQILLNQYFFADDREREQDKTNWVSRVLNRKPQDYFPDPWAIFKILEQMNI